MLLPPEDVQLLFGCIIGFFLAGIVGRVFGYFLWHWGRVTAIRNPQVVAHTTDQTPWQVLVDGCKSLVLLVGAFFLMVIALLLASYFFGWDRIIVLVRSAAQP